MRVEKITMPPKQAAAKLDAYRRKLDRINDPALRAEYEGAMAGYKSLARGTPVISLSNSILGAGLDSDGLPILAVVRADSKICRLEISPHGWMVFKHQSNGNHAGRTGWSERFQFTFPNNPHRAWDSRRAIVPMIPLDVRPARLDVRRHLILWEAHWTSEPPVDPMLLRPLAGDLYAVIAAWDLTAIERAVIAGRLQQ